LITLGRVSPERSFNLVGFGCGPRLPTRSELLAAARASYLPLRLRRRVYDRVEDARFGCDGREELHNCGFSRRDPVEEFAKSSRVRIGEISDRVVRCEDEPLLLLGEFDVRDGNRFLVSGESELDAEMTVDEVTRRTVHDHGSHKPDFVEQREQRVSLTDRVTAEITGVREELLGIFGPDSDDPIS
jgi:hypothetical protein